MDESASLAAPCGVSPTRMWQRYSAKATVQASAWSQVGRLRVLWGTSGAYGSCLPSDRTVRPLGTVTRAFVRKGSCASLVCGGVLVVGDVTSIQPRVSAWVNSSFR